MTSKNKTSTGFAIEPKEPTKHYHESGPEAEERERCVAEVARFAGRLGWPKSIGARVAKSGLGGA